MREINMDKVQWIMGNCVLLVPPINYYTKWKWSIYDVDFWPGQGPPKTRLQAPWMVEKLDPDHWIEGNKKKLHKIIKGAQGRIVRSFYG